MCILSKYISRYLKCEFLSKYTLLVIDNYKFRKIFDNVKLGTDKNPVRIFTDGHKSYLTLDNYEGINHHRIFH